MEILGYKLSDIDPAALVPVPDEINAKALRWGEDGARLVYHTVPDFDERVWAAGLDKWRDRDRQRDKPLGEQGHTIPTEVMKACGFSLDVYAKVQFATVIMCNYYDLMEKAYDTDVNWWLAWKLKNAMWHWCNHHDWNTQAYAIQSLPKFELPIFDEIRLDTSTYCNPKGFPVHHRSIYLDGPLAYICYLDGKPVMTISFAIAGPSKVIITQIQPIGKGNRWLYKFDRKKEVIKAFKRAFEGFGIYLACADSAIGSIEKMLVNSVSTETRILNDRISSNLRNPDSEYSTLESVERQRVNVQKATDHLSDFRTFVAPRMREFYPKGKGSFKGNNINFKKVA
jgi:hypothetical protein